MAGRLELVRPGGAAEARLSALLAGFKEADPLSPVSVVVPAQVVALDLRRRLAERGGYAATRFLTFSQLTELLGAGASDLFSSRRPLTRAALGAALRGVLKAKRTVFSPVATHSSTEGALADSYRQLAELGSQELLALASSSKRAADVVSIVEGARSALSCSFYDSDELTAVITQRLLRKEVELGEVGPIVAYLPAALASSTISLLQALAVAGEVVVLCSKLSDPRADASSKRLFAKLSGLGFEDGGEKFEDEKPLVDRVIGAPDLEEELRTALRLVIAHAEAGGELGRCAIALPNSPLADGYLQALSPLAAEAGLELSGPAGHKLSESAAGRLLRRAVALMADEGASFERAEVVALLCRPELSPHAAIFDGLPALTGGDRRGVRSGAIDRCSRAAGIRGGLDEWRARLSSYATRRPERLSRGAPPDVALALLELLGRLVLLGEKLRGAGSYTELEEALEEIVATLLSPSEEREQLEEAVAEISQLDGLEALERGSRFPAQLEAVLEAALGGPAGPLGRFGKGPVVGQMSTLCGLSSSLLVVVGMNEGVVPSRDPEDPLFSEAERERVGLVRAERAEERDRRSLLSLLAGAAESVCCYSRVDTGWSRGAYPSRWLSDDLFSGSYEEVSSFTGALAALRRGDLVALDGLEVELALSATTPGGKGRGSFPGSLLATRRAAEAERVAGPLSRFGGLVPASGALLGGLGETMSATRMESLARCPMSFMFKRLALVEVLEAPEHGEQIEPRLKGTIVHDVLEEVASRLFVGAPALPDDDEAELETRRALRRRLEAQEAVGFTGKAVYWEATKAELESDLVRFVRRELAQLRRSGARPVRTEVSFGPEKEATPVTIEVRSESGEERAFSFQGRIDRIDAEPGGGYRVIDYKSGSASGFSSMTKDPLGGGTRLQLPIYAKAVELVVGEKPTSVVAEYRFTSASASFKSIPVALTGELESSLEETLGVLADLVSGGTFAPHPGSEKENCKHCDYEQICRLDRGATWQRASRAPSLASYVALVNGSSK